MSRPLLVRLPLRTQSEANQREHHMAKARRVAAQRRGVGLALAAVARRVGLPAVVTLRRVGPSNGLDDDNLRSSLKAVRDGVADAFGVDDRRTGPLAWRYEQARGRDWAVEIELRRVEEP
jgi:hypothetical protein